MDDKLKRAFDLFENGNLEEAEALYDECLNEMDKGTASYETALHMMGFTKSALGKYEEARLLYLQLREAAQSEQHTEKEQIALHQLGMVERMAGNYGKAQEYFLEEIAMLERNNPTFHAGFAANYYEQGMILLKQHEPDRAESIMKKSLLYAEKSGDPISIGCSLRGLGEISLVQERRKEATDYWMRARMAFEGAGERNGVREIDELLQTE